MNMTSFKGGFETSDGLKHTNFLPPLTEQIFL